MSETVCAYCGKGNGWHAFWCLEIHKAFYGLDSPGRPRTHVDEALVAATEMTPFVAPSTTPTVPVLETMPEVE